MRPFTIQVSISAAREEVFDFVADLSSRPAWQDHLMKDFRLARANPYAKGAAARFVLDAPLFAQWAEVEIADFDRPRRIGERVRVGRLGRSHGGVAYDFSAETTGLTRVEMTAWSDPATRLDALKEALGRRWFRDQAKVALERLRMVFEQPSTRPLARATIAGYEASTASRFGSERGRTVPVGGAQASQ